MARFRKKPVVVEAWEWLGSGFEADAPRWLRNYLGPNMAQVRVRQDGTLAIPTLEGQMRADRGDWIICGVKGEIYPCKPDVFEATYEPLRGEG